MAFVPPPLEMASKESPLGPFRGGPRPLIEIGEVQDSLRREPSAGRSEGFAKRKMGGRRPHGRDLGGCRRRQGGVPLGARDGRLRGEASLPKGRKNDEADLLKLIEEVLSLAGRGRLTWAIDQPGGGGAALLLALLWERDQRVLYIPGLAIDRARDAYRGESKTDAKDAYVIAVQSRMRSDLGQLAPGEGELAELQFLLARRRDLVTDQSRAITRLRETLLSLFPALERALNLNNKGDDLTLVARATRPPPPPSAAWAARDSPPSSGSAASKEPMDSPKKLSPRPNLRA